MIVILIIKILRFLLGIFKSISHNMFFQYLLVYHCDRCNQKDIVINNSHVLSKT